jgi:predicted porin
VGLGEEIRFAVGFSMGNFRVVGQFDSLTVDAASSLPGDYSAMMIGGAYTMGSIVLKASIIDGEFDGALGFDVEQVAVGVDYKLSRRTTAYALYASGNNIPMGWNVTSDPIYGGVVVNNERDISVLSFGMIHTF